MNCPICNKKILLEKDSVCHGEDQVTKHLESVYGSNNRNK